MTPSAPGPPDLRPESGNLTKYMRIVDALRAAILGGQYPPGARLPNRDALARAFGCAPMTVRQALGELEKAGALDIRHGSGVYVTEHAPTILAGMPDPIPPGPQLDGMRATVSDLVRAVDTLCGEVREMRGQLADLITELRGCPLPEQRDRR